MVILLKDLYCFNVSTTLVWPIIRNIKKLSLTHRHDSLSTLVQAVRRELYFQKNYAYQFFHKFWEYTLNSPESHSMIP